MNKKCKVITFSRSKTPNYFNYSLGSVELQRQTLFKDLGIWFDAELTFVNHIEIRVNRAMKLLGFVFRTLREFDNIFVFKELYCAIVRSVLEYGSCIWQPFYKIHKDRIEGVQRRFLRRIATKLNIPFEEINHDEFMKLMNLTLENRKVFFDISTLYKIANSLVDAPELLSQVGFRIPPFNSRSKSLFNVTFHRTNYGINSPLSRMCVTDK